MKRVILIVLDGCGVGPAPDSADFGDTWQPNTILNVWKRRGGLDAINLATLGFWDTAGIEFGTGDFGRIIPEGMGKDSVTGHWEMMGAVVETPFPTYPNGFPIPLVKEFERRIGTQTLANRPASGTEIIADLGELHQETGFPILYTSADSVFQMAAHEDVVPVETLYSWCEIGREICVEPNNVQRVIARPFVGEPGAYRRTERRKDYPLPAPPNLVDEIGDVYGIGVVPELFGGRGFRPIRRTQSNAEHEQAVFEALESDARFIFANFEDFDMLYGHRSDPEGFGKCLERFSVFLGKLLERLGPDDLLILTADHGNDPTDDSTDHTRELLPLVLYNRGQRFGRLGDLQGLKVVGGYVRNWLGV